MAVYCEIQDVLALISYKTEIFYDAVRDVVADQMYADDSEDFFPMSASLEKHQKLLVAAQIMQQKEQEARQKAAAAAAAAASSSNTTAGSAAAAASGAKPASGAAASADTPKVNVISFKDKRDGASSASYKHNKIDLLASGRYGKAAPAVSALSATMKDLPSNLMQLKFFLPSEYGEPVVVRVQDNATVAAAIKAVVQKYNDLERTPPLNSDITCYELRMAEADGSPDEDLPKLGHNMSINRRLGACFALGIVEPTGDGAPKRRAAIRINLPNDQKTTIPNIPDNKISDIVQKLCVKRGWNAADYHCRIAPDAGPLSSTTTLGDLNVEELYFCPNTTLASGSVEDAPDSSLYEYSYGSIQFTCFNVRLIKTFGGKEERVLGLDSENITLSKTAKKGGASVVLRNQRSITEVSKISLSTRVAQFTIEWSDGKQDRFEADNDKLAREIVSKIEFIKASKA